MTEAQVGLLYNIASAIYKAKGDGNNTLLRSYYLMRCKDITRGYGLPDKYFSSKTRCPNCCIEWNKNTEIKVRSIKLSKRQKQRLRSKKITQSRKEFVRKKANLPKSNELEQVCTFCRKSTVTPVLKPQNTLQKQSTISKTPEVAAKEIVKVNNKEKTPSKQITPQTKKRTEVNVYANALDVFCMQNKNNTLASKIKEKPKPINNNKKKKDKFAGLCQKAVIASAKLKEQNKKQNSLNLFLKPSFT